MHAQPIDIPAALRAARRARRVSQRELAQLAGVPRSTVERIEAGHSDPRIGTFAKLLAAIGVEVLVSIGKQPIMIDTEREQLRDVLGRHFPPHWEIEPVRWLDRWRGWWRKHPNVRQFPPQYRYWRRRPADWDYLVARRWDDAT